MKKNLALFCLLLSGMVWGQQYDVYVEYVYRAFDYPIQMQIWNRTGSGNIYVRDSGGNIITSLSKTFETSNRGTFEDFGVIGNTTNSMDLSFSSNLKIDTSPQSFTASDSDALDGIGTVGFSMVTTPGWYLDGLISKRERIAIAVTGDALCYEDKAIFKATLGHPSGAYNWEFLNPITSNWESLGAQLPNKSISLVDILPNNFPNYIGVPINFRIKNTINNYTVPASYTWLDCSVALVGDPIATNVKCNGGNDGEVTLKFEEDIETDYEMRYFVFEGTPPTTPTDEQLRADPPIFPNQTFADPLGITMIPVNDGTGNYTGTFVGLDGSSIVDGGATFRDFAEYYIIYQEVNYGVNPVIVKSAGITSSFVIYQPSKIIPSATITQAQCNSNNAQINFSATGGNDLDGSDIYSYQYQLNGDGNWLTALTNPQPVPLTASDQTIQIRTIYSVGDCESDELTLTEKVNAAVPNLSFSNPVPGMASTNLSADGVISINYDGGTPNYVFELAKQNEVSSVFENVTNPPIVNTTLKRVEFRNLSVGAYRITVTDKNGTGCSLTTESLGDVTVSTTPLPVLGTENIVPISCINPTSGAITINVSGGVTPYNYEWTINNAISPTQSSSATAISLTNLSEPGTYILKVASNGFTDFNDPSGFVTTTIDLATPGQVSIDNTIITNITCNGAQNGSIVVAASGGINYEYRLDAFDNWQDLNGNTIPITAGGVYDLYLRDKDNGCEATPLLDALIVEEPQEIFVSEVVTGHRDVSINGGADGAISITVTGGTSGIAPDPEYIYNWIGTGPTNTTYSSTNQNITGLIAGFYEVTVTDANGCSPTNPLTVEIREPGPLAINNVTIETEISCVAVNDGSIVADVTGTSLITYEWTRDGAPFRTLIDENTISNLPPGVYQLFLNDGSQPVPLESNVLILIAPTVITADVLVSGSCSGSDTGMITISNVNGGTPGTFQEYTYSIDDGNSFRNSLLFENIAPGNYTVRVRDGNDCDFIQTDVLVEQFPAITLDAINTQVISVSAAGRGDGAISPIFSGGIPPFTYNWIGPGISGTTTKDITGLVEGNYTITVTDASGCTFFQNFEIIEPGELRAVLDQSVFFECNGDDFAEIIATVQGGVQPYSLEWFQTVNGTDNLLLEDSEILGSLSEGTYFLRVTDANGIIFDAIPITIDEPDVLEITVENTTDVFCSGDAAGAITVSVAGGTPPYSFVWSNGDTTQNLIGVEAGEYTLEVIDNNGCLAENTTTINAAPDAIEITDATITDISEYLRNDGSISLNVVGGAIPYTINWTRLSDSSMVSGEETISELPAGSYRVSISDTNGCSITETYEITQPDIVEETILPPTCAGDTDGSISLLVNRGNGTFTYEWSTGATTNTINGLVAGNYSVTISGFGNGPITRNYLIENPEPLSVDLGGNRTLCADQELVLDATVENELAVYSWTSDNGFSSNTPTVTLTQTGNYTVTITTPTGCSAQGSIFVDISTNEINAEFAVSSQVFVNETFVAVDISYPLPDSLEWILPDEATVLKKNGDEVELRFDTPGEYDIEIITRRGNCIAEKTKKIIVAAPDGAVTKEDTENGKKLIENFLVYPNPSDGKFTAEVNLTERGNVSIKVFSFANNAMMASKKDRGELSYSIPFDLSGLPAGVYAVLLETPYGNTLRKVILK